MAILTLKNVRLSFPHMFQPQVQQDGKRTYGANFILPPDHPQLVELNAAIKAVATEKWGAKADAELKALTASGRICLRDGNTKAYDGYADNWFISTSSKTRPAVIDRDTTPLDESSGKPYGGCLVVASISIWVQDNAFGKRINGDLRWVQFAKDGESFGGSVPISMDEFSSISDDEFESLV